MKNTILTTVLFLFLFSNLIFSHDLNIKQNTQKAPCTATIITQSQETCTTSFQLSAEAPENGEAGLWEGPPGTSFVAPDAAATFITGLNSGDNVITWSIFDANGNLCDSNSITLTNRQVITTPMITLQNTEVCDENGFQLTATSPVTGLGEFGVWSSDNGMVTFSPNDTTPNAVANNLVPGNNVIFWEIRNGSCTSNPATATIVNNEVVITANIEATSITEACESDGVQGVYANVFSDNLLPGETGTWTGPPGVIFSPNSEAPTISGLQPGPNLLVWTISRGICPVSSDSITLNVLDCYTPFPKDSTVWKEQWTTSDGPSYIETHIEQNYLLGDTIIDGQEYSLLYQGFYPYSPDSIPPHLAQTKFLGLITEINKRIYYRPSWDLDREALLYDFNLTVGDTIHWDKEVLPVVCEFATIGAIESVELFNGDVRKQYRLDNGSPARIIEGVGSLKGLLHPDGCKELSYGRGVVCVGTIDEIIYNDVSYWTPGSDDICFNTLVDVDNPVFSELSLTPNPATSVVQLSITINKAQLNIYSVDGKKVMSNDNFSGSQINIETLPNGIYFIVIYGEENYLMKMVKG